MTPQDNQEPGSGYHMIVKKNADSYNHYLMSTE